MKYTVVEADSIEKLKHTVSSLIGKGFEPLGGLCGVQTPGMHVGFTFFQAMVKR